MPPRREPRMIKKLLFAIPLILAPLGQAFSHDLISLNGQGKDHEDVISSGPYGSNAQQCTLPNHMAATVS